MGGRAVEGTGLENRQAGDRLVGSNPTPSATELWIRPAQRPLHYDWSADPGVNHLTIPEPELNP